MKKDTLGNLKDIFLESHHLNVYWENKEVVCILQHGITSQRSYMSLDESELDDLVDNMKDFIIELESLRANYDK